MTKRRRKRTYGGGQVVQRSPGGLWAIRYRVGSKRQFMGGFETRDLAERYLAKLQGEAATRRTGIAPDPRGVPTLAEFAEPFLERRKVTNSAAREDVNRWQKHLGPYFGHLRPSEVDHALIRSYAQLKLRDGYASGTIRGHVALLSSLYEEILEQGLVLRNPASGLPRSLRRIIRPSHDPRTTPFIERLDDVRRIFRSLAEPVNIAYAIGAFGGLRTGEVVALKWNHIDLATRRIHVRESVKGPLKDKESRIVPIFDSLLPVLREWKVRTGGDGVVVPPMRVDGKRVDEKTLSKYLRETLAELKLSRAGLGWYEATRHTFASQWVLAGKSIETLKEMMGHHSVVVTERYVHLRPDLFSPSELSVFSVDLRGGEGELAEIGQHLGSTPKKGMAKRPR